MPSRPWHGSDRPGRIVMRAGLSKIEGASVDVVVDFADNGPEFPEAFIDRVFEPFFTTRDDGTGYGLVPGSRAHERTIGTADGMQQRRWRSNVHDLASSVRSPRRATVQTAGVGPRILSDDQTRMRTRSCPVDARATAPVDRLAGRPLWFISLAWFMVVALAVARLRQTDGVLVAFAGFGASVVTFVILAWTERAPWRDPIKNVTRRSAT